MFLIGWGPKFHQHHDRIPNPNLHQTTTSNWFWNRNIRVTDYVGWTNPRLLQRRISATCAMYLLRNERKCKYIFMFLKINSAWKCLNYIHSLLLPFCVVSNCTVETVTKLWPFVITFKWVTYDYLWLNLYDDIFSRGYIKPSRSIGNALSDYLSISQIFHSGTQCHLSSCNGVILSHNMHVYMQFSDQYYPESCHVLSQFSYMDNDLEKKTARH